MSKPFRLPADCCCLSWVMMASGDLAIPTERRSKVHRGQRGERHAHKKNRRMETLLTVFFLRELTRFGAAYQTSAPANGITLGWIGGCTQTGYDAGPARVGKSLLPCSLKRPPSVNPFTLFANTELCFGNSRVGTKCFFNQFLTSIAMIPRNA